MAPQADCLPQARKAYDKGGKDFLKPGGGGGFDFGNGRGKGFKSRFGANAWDTFKDAFGGKDPFENFEQVGCPFLWSPSRQLAVPARLCPPASGRSHTCVMLCGRPMQPH